jgi:hypothetical protein
MNTNSLISSETFGIFPFEEMGERVTSRLFNNPWSTTEFTCNEI